MSRVRRTFVSTAAVLALPVLVGAVGLRELITRDRPGLPPAIHVPAPRPVLDPHRPTVVVPLGADLTEITDALGPYEMFARGQDPARGQRGAVAHARLSGPARRARPRHRRNPRASHPSRA